MPAETVLLYSGGMDSVIADRLCSPSLCLYVDTGAAYAEKELSEMVKPLSAPLVVDRSLSLAHRERADAIVPMRNAFLLLIAAYYGDEVILGATAGDRSTDKNEPFRVQMEALLGHLWQKQHWTQARPMRVSFPLLNRSKGSLVKAYLDDGGSAERLLSCVSCYRQGTGQCGECKPCARKWAALTWAGLDCDHVFKAHPRAYFNPETVQKIERGQWRGHPEDTQTLEVLNG